jgi:uncharacterized membrane protein
MDANAPRRGGSDGPRFGSFAVVAAVVALVAVVAIASSGAVPSGSVTGRRPSEGLLDTFFSLFIVFMALGAVAVVVMLSFFGRYTPAGDARKRRTTGQSVLTVVAAACVLAVVVRAVAGSDGNLDGILPGGSGGGRAPQAAPSGGYEPEFAVWPVLGITALVGVALVGWWLSARGRRRAVGPPLAVTPAEALADVLAVTLDDIRDETDPRRAVIRAYGRMERSLAAVGLPRSAAEAPEEYLDRVLEAVPLSERSAGRLTALFAWARFSGHDVRLEMTDAAIATLAQVQAELGAADGERQARLTGALG